MSYIDEIFERTEIQHITEFILNGSKLLEVDDTSYEQRLQGALNKALKMVQAYLPEENGEIENSIIQAVSVYEDVYMEIGLIVGIRLAMQIFNPRI